MLPPLTDCMLTLFGWQVAALSRSSWPAAQGTMVTFDPPGAAGDPAWQWHGHKSAGTEHVEALKTHHLLPAGVPPLCPPPPPSITTAAPFSHCQEQIVPMEMQQNISCFC